MRLYYNCRLFSYKVLFFQQSANSCYFVLFVLKIVLFWWLMATHRCPIKYQFPPDRPTLCVAPESRSKDPCFSLVSPPFLAIGAMEQVHEYSQVTLVKKLPPGPIKRAKKSKKLNPKWNSEVKGSLCPDRSANRTTLLPSRPMGSVLPRSPLTLCWRQTTSSPFHRILSSSPCSAISTSAWTTRKGNQRLTPDKP